MLVNKIIKLNPTLYGMDVAISAVYDSTDAEKDYFIDKLQEEITNIKQKYEIILADNLNRRVGTRENNKTLGRFGEQMLNVNRETLINLSKLNDVNITNGFFEHNNVYKYTWNSETRKAKQPTGTSGDVIRLDLLVFISCK